MLTINLDNFVNGQQIAKTVCFYFTVQPLSLSIKNKPGHVSANKELEVVCESEGGFPAPKLTWWLGSKMLRPDDEVRILNSRFYSLYDCPLSLTLVHRNILGTWFYWSIIFELANIGDIVQLKIRFLFSLMMVWLFFTEYNQKMPENWRIQSKFFLLLYSVPDSGRNLIGRVLNSMFGPGSFPNGTDF